MTTLRISEVQRKDKVMDVIVGAHPRHPTKAKEVVVMTATVSKSALAASTVMVAALRIISNPFQGYNSVALPHPPRPLLRS